MFNNGATFTKKELRESIERDSLNECYAHINALNPDDVMYHIGYIISETENDEPEQTIVTTKKQLKDVDLSSFRKQNELNPKVWVNGLMNSRVRLRLLDIADMFYDTLEIDWVKPKDIILTGSLANYNWSKYSDFDLHILVDFSEVCKNKEMAKDYFDCKKNAWNSKHEDLTIYGFPVEVYVQDVNEPHTASGIYSLEKNEWIVEPEKDKLKSIKLEKYYIKDKVLKYANRINKLYELSLSVSDAHKAEEIYNAATKLFNRIKNMRKASLAKGGEMSVGNIIFKALRRFGYLEIITNLKWKMFDAMFSIDDTKENK